MSSPGGVACCRNTSRTRRLARLRTTAPPSFLRGGDAESGAAVAARQHEHSHQAAVQAGARFRTPAGTQGGGGCGCRREIDDPWPPFARRVRGYRGEDTLMRFRPFARRRFKTMRPFLVLMRTRNPCVRRRRRLFG